MIDHLETQLELAIDLEVCSFLSLSHVRFQASFSIIPIDHIKASLV